MLRLPPRSRQLKQVLESVLCRLARKMRFVQLVESSSVKQANRMSEIDRKTKAILEIKKEVHRLFIMLQYQQRKIDAIVM